MSRRKEFECDGDRFYASGDFACSDTSRRVQIHKRKDASGNMAAGVVILEGGRQESAFFKQATGRACAEELVSALGGSVTWGLPGICD